MANFINPYNFIPLGKQRPYQTERREKTYSGVIRYSMLTKTPLFIPNTSMSHAFSEPAAEEDKDHKSYDFYSYTDLSGKENACAHRYYAPVIPGSSVRGLLRTQYEILTNSCMQVLEDSDKLRMGKRTAEIFRAGLLRWEKNGELALYQAEDCLMRTQGANSLKDDTTNNWAKPPRNVPASAAQKEHWNRQCYVQQDLQEGQMVYFAYVERGYNIKPLALQVGTQKGYPADTVGYVMKGEEGPDMHDQPENKHCCHIFTANGKWRKVKGSSLEADELNTLCENIKVYQQNINGQYREYGRNYAAFWKEKVAGRCFPVYFSYIKELDYVILSPAARTREIYRNNIRSLAGAHVKCTDKAYLCPACQLFGTLGRGFGRTSNVRFTDLTLEGLDGSNYSYLYEKPVTLLELSSPKISNMEFYLKRPATNAWFWTYDYYIDNNGKVHSITPELNGRKFYWHNLKMKLDHIQSEPNHRNVTVRPVKDKVTFTGKIYFDKIRKEELDMLIYVVNAGDEAALKDKTHGYKLGMGKPLGLGSVALSVDQVLIHERKLDYENRSVKITDEPYEQYAVPELNGKDTSGLAAQFEKMTSFELPEFADGDITYPRDLLTEKPEEQVFKWFTDRNHRAYRTRRYEGDRVINKSPNARTQQFYAQYLQALSPKLYSTGALEEIDPREAANMNGNGRRTNGVARGSNNSTGNTNGDSRQQIDAVWIAAYGINPDQRRKLPKIGKQSIYYHQSDREWATEEKLRKAAAEYRAVLLPAKTRKDLVNLALELFDHVVMTKTGADGRSDDGWELKK